jgi:predicted nucleic acid-binding protein
MIVVDTCAMIALIDADDRHHEQMVSFFEQTSREWVLPWAILPEVDYLLSSRVSERAAMAFRADLAAGAFFVEWGEPQDLVRAHALCTRYAALTPGLVDAMVGSVAERLKARAIATLDERDFGSMELKGTPKLFPRDGERVSRRAL